jgi:hypothetical protein
MRPVGKCLDSQLIAARQNPQFHAIALAGLHQF